MAVRMKGDWTPWVVLVVFLVILAGNGFNIPIISNFVGSTGGGPDGDNAIELNVNQPDKACGSTTMTVDFSKKYSQSTDMTAQNATVYINGNQKGVYDEGGTFTAQGGDTLNVYYALEDLGNSYYAAHASGKIPCTGQTAAFTTSNILGAGSLAGAMQNPVHQVYASGTAPSAATVYNKKTLTDLTSTALALGVGSTETARTYLSWTNEEGYGVADGNTLACRFTEAHFDQSETYAVLDGTKLGPAKYIPSMTRFSLSSANQSTKYWAFPAIDGKQTPTSTLDLIINADDTNQPTAASNFSCEIIDTDLYITDDGEVKVDVEDRDDNSNIGRSTEYVINVPVS